MSYVIEYKRIPITRDNGEDAYYVVSPEGATIAFSSLADAQRYIDEALADEAA